MGQFSLRHFFGVVGAMSLNNPNRRRVPKLGRPVSMTLFSVFTIIVPPLTICFAVFVPTGSSWIVSVN